MYFGVMFKDLYEVFRLNFDTEKAANCMRYLPLNLGGGGCIQIGHHDEAWCVISPLHFIPCLNY